MMNVCLGFNAEDGVWYVLPDLYNTTCIRALALDPYLKCTRALKPKMICTKIIVGKNHRHAYTMWFQITASPSASPIPPPPPFPSFSWGGGGGGGRAPLSPPPPLSLDVYGGGGVEVQVCASSHPS